MEPLEPVRTSQSRARVNPASLDRFHQLTSSLRYHLYTAYLIFSNNIWDTIIPGFFFGTINSFVAPRLSMGPALSLTQILVATPSMLLWSCSNVFVFCLHNQKRPENIAEDMINKPWRPIATGRLTPNQAVRLLYIVHPFCLFVAIYIGGLGPYIGFEIFCAWYNEFGGANNGLLRSICNGVGLGCLFAGPLEVATGRSMFSGKGGVWIGILMATIATTSHIQDFRDMEGDKASNRRTIPLVTGETNARILAIVGIGCWTELTCRFWSAGWLPRSICFATGVLLGSNLLLDRTNAGDIRAWKLWPIWVWTLFAIPVFQAN